MKSVTIDFLAAVNFLGIVQGFLLAIVFLLSRRRNRRSNQLMGLFFLTGVLTTGEIFASYTGLIAWFPSVINSTECLDFLMGPLIYWYTLSLIRPGFSWKHEWLHLIPAVVFLLLRLPYLLQSPEFKLQDVYEVYHRIAGNPISVQPILWFPKYHFGGVWLDWTAHPHILAYLAYCLYMIRRFTHVHRQSFWRPSNLSLRRTIRVILFIVSLQVLVALISFVSTDDLGDIYIAVLASLGYYFASFWVIQDSQSLAAKSLVFETEKKKYGKSSLNEQSVPDLVQKLTACMATEKPYLDGNLTLPTLAEKLRISTHHLSQLLNEQVGKPFSDFVNEFRVEELKQKLQDPALAHLKIEELAFDSGFNSKSVFNAAFKKATGVTPSQFRRVTT